MITQWKCVQWRTACRRVDLGCTGEGEGGGGGPEVVLTSCQPDQQTQPNCHAVEQEDVGQYCSGIVEEKPNVY